VMATHDLRLARRIADTVVFLDGGTVVEQGPTGRLLDSPQHPYTQRLRASVPGPGWKPSRSVRETTVS